MKKNLTRGSVKKIVLYTISSLVLLALSFVVYINANIKNDDIYMKPLPKDLLAAPELNLSAKDKSYNFNASPSRHGLEVNSPIRKGDFAKRFSYFSCQDIDQIEDKNLKQKIASVLEEYGIANIARFEVISGVLSVMKLDGQLKPVLATSIDARTGNTIELRDIFADNVDAGYEINKKVAYYLLSHAPANFRYDKWKGISLDTPFVIYEDFANKNSYLMLFFDDKTPVLKGQTLVFNLKDFGNNGDNIAYYNRFPAFANYDEFYKQTSIKADPLNIASLYYFFGEKKDPWKFYEKYKPEGWFDPLATPKPEPTPTTTASPLPTVTATIAPIPTLPKYDDRFDLTYFSGTTKELMKIPLSEYVLDKDKKVKFKYKIEGVEPTLGTKNLLKDLLNKFYIYEIPFGLGS